MKIVLFLIFFIFDATSSDKVKNLSDDLSIDPARSTVILDGIKYEIEFHDLNFKLQRYIFRLLQQINTNTQYLNRNEVNHFFISELYKLTLSSNIIKESTNHISESIVLSSIQKLASNKEKYSPFSKHIIQQFINDYSIYTKNGYLKKYYQGELQSHTEKQKIKLLIKYSAGWVASFNTLSILEFNNLTNEHFLVYLNALASKSSVFKFNERNYKIKYNHIFQFKNLQYYQNVFNKKAPENGPESTQTTQTQQATDAIKDINVEIEDTASKEIDTLIKNIEEKP